MTQRSAAEGTCPCCGHRTLAAPSPSWLTCPVCYWTDEELVTPGEVDALFKAQRAFRASGASDAHWLGKVRPPRAGEEIDPAWHPLAGVEDEHAPTPRERASAALEKVIAYAFSDVEPAGRTTLREAYKSDYHGHEADLDWDDRDTAWEQIPMDVLEYFERRTSVFIFGNTESFRYYLPAYMRYALRTGMISPTLYALDLALAPGVDPESLERVAALDAEQRDAVVAFLRFCLDYTGPDKNAERALERIWGPVTGAS